MKVPFDSLCLAASIAEMREWAGAKIQRVVQVDSQTVGLELYAGRVGALILSFDPERARVLIAAKRLGKGIDPTGFVADLRRILVSGYFLSADQIGLDRVAHLRFETGEGAKTLIAELMGKHTSLILVNPDGRMLASAKWLGKTKARRPILPGRVYEPPPLDPRPSVLLAADGDDLRSFEGVSPFLARWIAAVGEDGLARVQQAYRLSRFEPTQSDEGAAYPLSLVPLGFGCHRVELYSGAAEEYFSRVQELDELGRRKSHLLGQLRSLLRGRETTLAQLEASLDTASHAADLQLRGELILAYQSQIPAGAAEFVTVDYDGVEISVRLNPELSAAENAEAYFRKAKKAKHGSAEVQEQYERIRSDATSLRSVIVLAEEAADLAALDELESEARARRWLQVGGAATAKEREQRPYEGKPIRELIAPGGWKVLYGTNSDANDYLTLRVAKPNDWWLHVRGAPSCHVVIQTSNQPLKVQREALEFAALVACRNSTSKHSGIVAVDYTLKKYVRRPKGAAPGLASYTHEKTLHVHPNEK